MKAQINEFKASQIPSLSTLKSTLLDPAVNIIVQKLKTELSSTKASLEETQNELNAWKFTPDRLETWLYIDECFMREFYVPPLLFFF